MVAGRNTHHALAIGCLLLLGLMQHRAAGQTVAAFGPGTIALNGPWKFHTGDNLHWADPQFDDSAWETMDLTPLPGAHDGDVGLTGYVPGWAARGHHGFGGFAWYRMLVRNNDPSTTLWLAGPALVDDAWQLYFNGRLLGGIGDFESAPPRIRSSQPRLFALPREGWIADGQGARAVIAVRVACVLCSSAESGGMHIAPILGTEEAVRDRYRLQWVEKIEGYVVDAAQPLFFVLLAAFALVALPFDPKNRFSAWIAAFLALLALARANQPLYWLGQFETLQDFVVWRLAIVDALILGAWVMAWRAAYGLRQRWMVNACLVLTVVYVIARIFGTPFLWPEWPKALTGAFATLLKMDRLGFLALLVAVVSMGQYRAVRTSWISLLAFLFGSIGLFAPELSQIGVPGIWFPYGIGVSRSEYAYAAMVLVLAIELVGRLWRFVPTAPSDGRQKQLG